MSDLISSALMFGLMTVIWPRTTVIKSLTERMVATLVMGWMAQGILIATLHQIVTLLSTPLGLGIILGLVGMGVYLWWHHKDHSFLPY